MKRLHRYMIRIYIGPLVMTFVLAMIVLILQFVWKYIDELVGKGLSWSVISELLLYVSASLVPMAVILGVLLSSIMTFGTLGEHSELTALKSSGISLTRIMAPLMVLAILITAGAFVVANYVIPKTNMKFYTLLLDIRKQRPEFDLREKQFYNGLDGYSLKIGRRSRESQMLYDLMIYDHTSKLGDVSVMVADSGYMAMTEDKKNLMLTLYSGSGYTEQLDDNRRLQKNKPFRRDKFTMQRVLFKLPSSELDRTEEDLFKDNRKRKNLKELQQYINTFRPAMVNKRERAWRDMLESHYFKLADKKDSTAFHTAIPDSLKGKNLDIQALYDSLPDSEKSRIMDHTLNLARASQSMVRTTSDIYRSDNSWMAGYQIEWHRKFTMSLACLIFFLIGAPLGAIIRRGGLGTPVVVSTFLFILYYIISLAGEKYARAGMMPVAIGMWGSTAILLAVGIYLTVKSTRDSSIMSGETYMLFFRKFFRFGRQNDPRANENPPDHQ